MIQMGLHSFLAQDLGAHIFAAEDAFLLFMIDGAGAPGNECRLRRQDKGRLGRVEGVEGPNSSVAFPGAKSRNTSQMMNA
jgi:hypothetical protein